MNTEELSDKELIDLSGRAMGWTHYPNFWNPLTHRSDAFSLMVKSQIQACSRAGVGASAEDYIFVDEADCNDDPELALCRAITIAAVDQYRRRNP